MLQGKKIWLIVSVYVNSAAIGVICLWMLASPKSNAPEKIAENESRFSFDELMNSDVSGDLVLQNTLSNGDRQFQQGEFDRAIRHYKGSGPESNLSDAAYYRIGLALEATARFQDAKSIYTMLKESSKRDYFKRAASLGLARLFQKTGKATEGRTALWRIFLDREFEEIDSTRPDTKKTSDPGLSGATAHLLSIAYANQLIRRNSSVSTDLDIPVHVELPFDPQFYLADLLENTGAEVPLGKIKTNDSGVDGGVDGPSELVSQSSSEQGKLIVEKLGEGIDLKGQMVRIHAKPTGLVELLLALEEELGLKISYSQAAGAAVEFRSQSISIEQVDLATLLHGLFGPLDLQWKEVDGVINVFAEADLDADTLEELRYERAVHLLRYSIFDYPDNHYLSATQYVFGNLSFQNREWSTAIANYREALKTRVLTSYVRQRASFNMGKAFLQLGQIEQAESALFFAVDDSFGGDLAATGLIIIARQRVLRKDYESAIKHSSRAIMSAMSQDLKQQATVLLSSVYLLNGKYFAGNQALMDNKSNVIDQRMVDLSVFLSAYARYFAQSVHKNEEPEDLLRSLNLVELPVPGLPHLPILVSKAQREFGFQKQSVESMVSSFTTMPDSKLREEFRSEISRALLEAGPYSEVMQLYENILATDPDVTETPTQLIRNAKLEFNNANYENCKRLCEKVLQLNTLPEFEKQALILIGRAYERTGDYHTAATYFAGLYEKSK